MCDLDSGNCDPHLLRRLLDGKASVRSLKGLHAKVYISSRGTAVGSANLTPNGLGAGAIEATAVVKGSPADCPIRKWFNWLLQESDDVTKRLSDPVEFAKLVARWKARQASHKEQVEESLSATKPSLLSAILNGHPLLNDLAFSWYTNGAELQETDVKKSALRQGIPIPRKSNDWTWIESPFKPGLLKRLNKACRGKPHIAWKVRLDDEGAIERFMAHDAFASEFLGGLHLRGILVSIMGNYSVRTPFDLRADRDQLAKLLTRGVSRANAGLKRTIDNHLSMLSVSQLTQLTELGIRT